MPLRTVHEGRWVVSRAWVRQLTGASAGTVDRWYAQRHGQPEERRHPEVVHVIGRTQYFDQRAVEAFWVAWREDVGTGRLGRAGRKPGSPATTDRSRRDQAVGVALAALYAEGGHRRGLAARLAREHGGVPRSWQRAVTEARALYEAEGGDSTS